jgi:hypothetical protein
VVWVEGDDGSTAQTSAKQDTLAEPQGAGESVVVALGVTLEDGGSKLKRVQSRGGGLLAEKATLCVKDGW